MLRCIWRLYEGGTALSRRSTGVLLLPLPFLAERRLAFRDIRFIAVGIESIRGYIAANHAGKQPDMIALASKLTMTGLLLVYVILCVRSFIAARRSRLV